MKNWGPMAWLRSLVGRDSGSADRRRDLEPETASERAVKVPLEELRDGQGGDPVENRGSQGDHPDTE